MGSLLGKIEQASIVLAMEDFYLVHQNYTTKVVLHIKDSMGNSVKAASAGKCSALRYVMEVKKTVFVTFSLSTSLCMHLLNITFALSLSRMLVLTS